LGYFEGAYVRRFRARETSKMNSDGKQLQELLDQVRQRATAAEEALEAAEERSEKYRAMIDEANIELNQFKEKVCPGSTDQSVSDQKFLSFY